MVRAQHSGRKRATYSACPLLLHGSLCEALKSSVSHSCESMHMETPNDPNPYQAPVVTTPSLDSSEPGADFVPSGSTLSAGEGVEWISAAWQLFVKFPMMWIVMIVLYAIFYVALAFVPFVGSLAGYLLYGIIGAGWLASAHAVATDKKLEIDYLFSGFKERTNPLFIIGAFYAGGLIGILLLMVLMAIFIALALGASGVFGALMSGDTSELATFAGASIMTFLFVFLIGLALLAPLLMAMWFAPALVYFHDVEPVQALKTSFFACLKNWLPFTIYGMVMILLVIVAAIPLMLGFLVVGPIALISMYTSYRAVFMPDARP